MSTIQGDGFDVTVIRSRRKTISLKIKEGIVSVHMPMRASISIAEEFILKKTAWINRKLAEQEEKHVIPKHYVEGEHFLFLGKEYQLKLIQENKVASIKKTNLTLELRGKLDFLAKSALRRAVITWYRQQATLYLTSQTAFLANKTGLTPSVITVKTYKARWGSCSSKGEINYNWKLVLAPPDIVDYVIIHELCHLQHHNHSKDFWALVKDHCPSYAEKRYWLKSHGYLLEI